MKLNKKTKFILMIILIIILAALMTFVLATNNSNNKSKMLVTRDKTSVILQQQSQDPTKVDVYLGMADDSSIASFQIGLNVDVASNYDAKFEWSTNLNDGTEEFKDVRMFEGTDVQTNRDLERINLYYVGTKELNQLTDTVNIDNIKVGTISLVNKTDENENSTLLIQPVGSDGNKDTSTDEEFTKTVSLSHEVTPVIIEDDDILRTSVGGTSSENPGQGDSEEENPGQGDSGEGNPGQGDSGEGNPGQGDSGEENPGQGNTNQGNSGSTNAGGSGSSNTQNSGAAGNTNTAEDKKSGGSIIDKVITSIKTGANRSNLWAICLLVVLIIMALGIIYIKSKAKKSKH